MAKRRKVRVALCGAGGAAEFHLKGLSRVFGYEAEVSAICAPHPERAGKLARRFGIPEVTNDFEKLLSSDSIDVIDICAPSNLHPEMTRRAMEAGKHVICEKPAFGYFGEAGDPERVGDVPRKKMYERVAEESEKLRAFVKKSGRRFMYAENWIYAPAVARAAELLSKSRDRIIMMKADESHSGSYSELASQWKYQGGGALIRQGCHPLSAVLYLKRAECAARGAPYGIKELWCDVSNALMNIPAEDRTRIAASPVDVEDGGLIQITFIDGTKASVFSSDAILGGMRNNIEVNTTNGNIYCKISQNDSLMTYAADGSKMDGYYVTGNLETKEGYQYVMLDEEWFRGQIQEFQDFIECAAEDREPLSNIDIACETSEVLYAAYLSAEEKKAVSMQK